MIKIFIYKVSLGCFLGLSLRNFLQLFIENLFLFTHFCGNLHFDSQNMVAFSCSVGSVKALLADTKLLSILGSRFNFNSLVLSINCFHIKVAT